MAARQLTGLLAGAVAVLLGAAPPAFDTAHAARTGLPGGFAVLAVVFAVVRRDARPLLVALALLSLELVAWAGSSASWPTLGWIVGLVLVYELATWSIEDGTVFSPGALRTLRIGSTLSSAAVAAAAAAAALLVASANLPRSPWWLVGAASAIAVSAVALVRVAPIPRELCGERGR